MTVFKNVKVIFPDKIRDCTVSVRDGKIVSVSERADVGAGDTVIDGNGRYLSPGFVDIHVHGGGGKSAMSKNPDDIVAMCEAHLGYGTTSMLPTTLASKLPVLIEAVGTIKCASERSKKSNILGVHLEGPYISREYRGAQQLDNILVPTVDSPRELLSAWKGIRMMGAAPEIDGGLPLGRAITEAGAVASIAHSGASFETAEEAVNYGYSDVTHIYSACSSCYKVNLFRVGGVVEAGLALDGLTAQAIADLRHLPAGILRLIYKCKGAEKMILITDGLEFSASEIAEGTVLPQENGVDAVYEDGVMKLKDYSALAGSVATSSRLVRNMYKTVQVPLYDAVRMASLTPAERIGFGGCKGKIGIGCDADLIMFDENIDVSFVMTNGNIIKK